MGGKAGLIGRLAVVALIAAAFVFGSARTVSADPSSYVVTIGNAAAASAEGDASGANSMTFPVTVSGPSPAPDDISVAYTSSEGLTPALTIPSGTALPATINFAVPINGNTTPQDDRTMTVALTGAQFATDTTDTVSIGSAASATGTIVDDDWRIASISSDPANATVSESSGTIDFKATLLGADGSSPNAPPNHAISVDFALADGTGDGGAVFNKNYKVTDPAGKKSGTLVFAPGTNVVHVKVQGINDGQYGFDKQFSITLSNPQGASFAAGATVAATGTITEVSAAPIVGVGGCGTVNGGGDATFPFTSSFASPVPATVKWSTSDVTTIAGDYDGGTGTATIPAGTRDGSITIHTHANPPAGDRQFKLTISDPQHATILSSAASGTCTVHQPQTVGTDMLPSAQLTDPAPVAQPATGSVPVTVSVTLNAPVTQPAKPAAVDLNWATQDGTATAPADYNTASGTLHWDAGKFSTQTFTVQVNAASGTSNAPKKFTIAFQTVSAAFVGANVVNVTVVPPSSPPVISVADASALESAGSIPAVVSLAPAPQGAVTVHYATADGTAKAGADYTAVNGTLTFQAGQTQKTVSIPITNDNVVEGNRAFSFVLSGPTGATLGTARATMTIRNDDAPPAPAPVVSTTGNQQKPTPIPTPQPTNKTAKHVVLVQILTGQSTVDTKGYAHFMMKCPVPAVKSCVGTIVLQVRVQAKKKAKGAKKAPLKTVNVGSGTFKIKVGKSIRVKVKVTKQGLLLLKTYRRIKVKATVRAKDTQNVKGVTAWFVTVQAPARQITIKSP